MLVILITSSAAEVGGSGSRLMIDMVCFKCFMFADFSQADVLNFETYSKAVFHASVRDGINLTSHIIVLR